MTNDYESRYGLETFDLYNFARAFRVKVYRLIRLLPTAEKYCLVPQMRRAAISISNNIAEGHGRWHFQENVQFCRVARGSLEEIVDDLNICLDEGYADKAMVLELKQEAQTLIARINSYVAYLKKNHRFGE